ncbi:MAG: YhbY family RNA-binding protein [Candidatus Thalassarchaeaceae archaeon]|jgi:RNA-binding protein|nr:YhbY family RNA-binding protein [Candidatus Thalassarchaeaceae archaeon]
MTTIPKDIANIAHNRDFKVTIRVGRSGLTDAVYDELSAQLDSRKVVKIKINRGLVEEKSDRQELFNEIAEQVGATLVDSRGNVAIYWRP